MNYTFVILILFLTNGLCYSQEIMTKVVIDNGKCYFVELDSLNKNGLIVRCDVDSMLNSKIEKSKYLHVGAFDRYNHSKINYDAKSNKIYTVSALKLADVFDHWFIESDYSKADKIDCLKPLSQLGLKSSDRLGMYCDPIENPYYLLYGVKDYTIFFDLVYMDSSRMKTFVYNQWTQKLEHWEYKGEIAKSKEIRAGYESTKWSLLYQYDLEYAIESPFVSFAIKGITYLVMNDGTIFIAGEKLTKFAKLPGDLKQGLIIVDKDSEKASYLLKEKFNLKTQAIGTLLKNASPIELK